MENSCLYRERTDVDGCSLGPGEGAGVGGVITGTYRADAFRAIRRSGDERRGGLRVACVPEAG